MKNTVMTDYVAKGLSGLTPAAIKPTKEVTTGYYSSLSWSGSVDDSSDDQFWLLSYSKIFGTGGKVSSGTYKLEGTQYKWC